MYKPSAIAVLTLSSLLLGSPATQAAEAVAAPVLKTPGPTVAAATPSDEADTGWAWLAAAAVAVGLLRRRMVPGVELRH